MKPKDAIKLIVSIVICEGTGGLASIFTVSAIPTWYAGLIKPAFTPPNYVFMPVWVTLYLLMGIAVFLIWRKGLVEAALKSAFVTFWAQLFINFLWVVLFFGLKSPLAGAIAIILLWIAILITIIRFFRVSAAAGWLLIPYIVWVSIASYLNIGVWVLNL